MCIRRKFKAEVIQEEWLENKESDKTAESIKIPINQELIIDSINKAGTKIIIPEKGSYKFTIIEGAYTIYEKEQNKGWLTLISIFINKPLEFEDRGYGPHPINEDATIGFAEMIANYDDAENIGKSSSLVRNLNQGDYMIVVIPDSYYDDNSGTIKISIEKID